MCVEPDDIPVKEKTFSAEPPITQEVRNWCLWYAGMLDRHASEYTKLALELENNPATRDDLVGETRLRAIGELRGQAIQCEGIAMDITYRTDPDLYA